MHIRGCIFFHNPPKQGGRNQMVLGLGFFFFKKIKEEWKRREGKEKKGDREGKREGKREGEAKEKGKEKGKGKEKKKRVQKERKEQKKNEEKGKEGNGQGGPMQKNWETLGSVWYYMTEGYQGCIFFYNSRPRVAETKWVNGKEGQRKGKSEGEGEKKEKKRK